MLAKGGSAGQEQRLRVCPLGWLPEGPGTEGNNSHDRTEPNGDYNSQTARRPGRDPRWPLVWGQAQGPIGTEHTHMPAQSKAIVREAGILCLIAERLR